MAEELSSAAAPGRHQHFEIEPRRGVGYRIARGIIMGLTRVWFRPQVHLDAPLPSTGPVLVAPIHRSNLDFLFAVLLTDRKLFFMAKDSLWKSKLLGRFLVAMGAFPVHRESADRESLNRAEEVLARGEVLVLFPEGTRQEGPEVATLLEGATYLASKTGAPIVPLGIGGSDRAMPKGAKFPKPVKVKVVAGQPLAPAERSASGRVSRAQVKVATAALSEAIQAVYDRSLKP